jgi:hypothetical protein
MTGDVRGARFYLVDESTHQLRILNLSSSRMP